MVFAWELIAQTNNAGLIYMQRQLIQWTNKWVCSRRPVTGQTNSFATLDPFVYNNKQEIVTLSGIGRSTLSRTLDI